MKNAILNFVSMFSYRESPVHFGLYFTADGDSSVSIADELNPISMEILLEHFAPLNQRYLSLTGWIYNRIRRNVLRKKWTNC